MNENNILSQNVKDHTPAPEGAETQQHTGENHPDDSTRDGGGLCESSCSTLVENTWPVGIDLSRPDFGASLIDGNALIYLWQKYDKEYYSKQYKLIRRGLEENEIKIHDETILLRSSQPS